MDVHIGAGLKLLDDGGGLGKGAEVRSAAAAIHEERADFDQVVLVIDRSEEGREVIRR